MTQFCIDTTRRRAISEGLDFVLVSDGHMNGGSGPLGVEEVIAHHNRSLDGLDAGRARLRLATTAEPLGEPDWGGEKAGRSQTLATGKGRL